LNRPQPRHLEGWIQLCKRLQHEVPLVQPRVGNLQPWLRDRLVAVEQKVKIERSRPPRRDAAAVTSEEALELEQRVEQLPRREVRLELRGAVEKPGLVDEPDRVGVTQLRDRHHLGSGQAPRPSERCAQGSFAVTEVRAETDEGASHPKSLVAGLLCGS
jgi:hypothetical protein